jgi:hypothetical protein
MMIIISQQVIIIIVTAVETSNLTQYYIQLGNGYEMEIITYRRAFCLQIWRVAANIFNKQSQTADKG